MQVKGRKFSNYLLAITVLLVGIIWFIAYYSQTSTLILTKNNEISSLQNQVSSLQGQTSSLQNQVTSLQNQNATLQSIVNLSQSSAPAKSITVNAGAQQSTQVISFMANYAGYIIVSGTSTTSKGYVKASSIYGSRLYNDYEY